MRIIYIMVFNFIFILGCLSSENYEFRHSALSWENLNIDQWLDFDEWKVQRKYRDSHPFWKREKQINLLRESIGRVMACEGKCELSAAKDSYKVQSRSIVREGDEFSTGKNSYAWIFLFDGSLLRISPDTSVSFNEINISQGSFFYYIRLNFGHVYVKSRTHENLVGLRETDTIFNKYLKKLDKNLSDFNEVNYTDYVKSFLSMEKKVSNKLSRLEESMKQNDSWLRKKTYFLFVTSNISFYLKSPIGHIYNEFGQETLYKFSSFEKGMSFLRGYGPLITESIPLNDVYKVDRKGKSQFPFKESFFNFTNKLVERPYSVYGIREQWLKKYSKNLHNQRLNQEFYLTKLNYRLWSGYGQNSRLSKRVNHLIRYTRKLETSHLTRVRRYFKRRGIKAEVIEKFPRTYFGKAIDHFAQSLDYRDLKSY